MSGLNVLAEVVAWVEPVAGGWRYLFSRGFRARIHESWRHESIGYIMWDVFWGILGIAASLTIGYFVVARVWRVAAL